MPRLQPPILKKALTGLHRVMKTTRVAAIEAITIPWRGAQLVAQYHKKVPWLRSRNMIILLNLSVSGVGLFFRTEARLEDV